MYNRYIIGYIDNVEQQQTWKTWGVFSVTASGGASDLTTPCTSWEAWERSKSWYSRRCSGDASTYTSCTILGGKSARTRSLVRRNMKGFT